MKAWIMAIALAAVLGMSSFADAGGAHGKKIHGKITAISDTSMTITTGGKKNPHTMTVQFTAGTPVTIDGATGKLDSSLIGKHVSIQGGANGDIVTASAIAVTTKHHGKKKAATTQPTA